MRRETDPTHAEVARLTATADDFVVEVPRTSLEGLREESQHLLLWQAKGESRFVVAGRTLTLSAGHALWVPARTEHEFTIAPQSALLPMFFDVWRFPDIVDAPAIVAIDSHAETACLALIGSQYSLVQPAADLEAMVLAIVQAQVVAPIGTTMPLSPAALQVARSVVLNPADRRTLATWAVELHVSTRTLERAFQAETGLSWQRWRQHQRMLRAAHLLATTRASVTDIALRVGFGTPSAFARAFRDHHGLTPSEYRELYGRTPRSRTLDQRSARQAFHNSA